MSDLAEASRRLASPRQLKNDTFFGPKSVHSGTFASPWRPHQRPETLFFLRKTGVPRDAFPAISALAREKTRFRGNHGKCKTTQMSLCFLRFREPHRAPESAKWHTFLVAKVCNLALLPPPGLPPGGLKPCFS